MSKIIGFGRNYLGDKSCNPCNKLSVSVTATRGNLKHIHVFPTQLCSNAHVEFSGFQLLNYRDRREGSLE